MPLWKYLDGLFPNPPLSLCVRPPLVWRKSARSFYRGGCIGLRVIRYTGLNTRNVRCCRPPWKSVLHHKFHRAPAARVVDASPCVLHLERIHPLSPTSAACLLMLVRVVDAALVVVDFPHAFFLLEVSRKN